jgi:hypothetical protein
MVNHIEILENPWVWTEEVQMNPKEFKKKLLLAKDNYGYIAWHRAAVKGSLEALEALRVWVKEVGQGSD